MATFLAGGSAQRERTRVARHLWRAERVSSQRCVSKLSPVQRTVRRLLLAELRNYRLAGLFPENPQFAEPTPFFVDGRGTRCAVAHLLEFGGEGDLVRRIARERNNARVVELTDEPRLTAWLDASGLTLDEAALIQPSYCGEEDPNCLCSNRAAGYLEATTTTYPRDGLATAEVKAIHGQVEPGLEVGSEILVQSQYRDVPVELIVQGAPVDELADGTPVYRGSDVTRGFSCGWSGKLSKQQYLQALRSSNCPETVRSFEEWIPEGCRDSGCGCRVAGAASPSSAGILVALLGVVVARRMARPNARRG
jgi:MYXO-CTERM domain-containing protein